MTIRATASMFVYNLEDATGEGDFEFRRFPRQIDTDDQANWEQIDVAGFVKPLHYANNDPQVIEVQEAWLDNSETGASVLPEIENLRRLMKPGKNGAPPLLRLICGDWETTVILKNLRTERTRFTSNNIQVRARLSLTFWEAQGGPAQPKRQEPGNRPEDAKFSF